MSLARVSRMAEARVRQIVQQGKDPRTVVAHLAGAIAASGAWNLGLDGADIQRVGRAGYWAMHVAVGHLEAKIEAQLATRRKSRLDKAQTGTTVRRRG